VANNRRLYWAAPLSLPLKIHSDKPWTLYYYLTPAQLEHQLAPLYASQRNIVLVVRLVLGLLFLFGLFVVYRQYQTFKQIYDLRRIEVHHDCRGGKLRPHPAGGRLVQPAGGQGW
jgi:hypothetical protein